MVSSRAETGRAFYWRLRDREHTPAPADVAPLGVISLPPAVTPRARFQIIFHDTKILSLTISLPNVRSCEALMTLWACHKIVGMMRPRTVKTIAVVLILAAVVITASGWVLVLGRNITDMLYEPFLE
jgi:hypothetical protein